MREKENYTRTELSNINNFITGSQIHSGFMTLCADCHTEEHIKQGDIGNISIEDFDNFHEQERQRKRIRLEYELDKNIVPFLERNIGEKIIKPDIWTFKSMFKKKEFQMRTQGINAINSFLSDNNLKYKVVSKRTSKDVEGKNLSYTYWTIVKII